MSLEGQEQSARVREALRATQSQDRASSGQQSQEGEQRGSDSRRTEARRTEGRLASLSTIGRANPTAIAMSNTGEVLEQFRRDLAEAMPSKDDNNMLVANIFPIDASTAGIPFSLVIVAATKRGKETLGVGYHTFLLAGSAERLLPRDESYRGNRVTILQVPGDGYDSRSRDVIKEVLQQHYGSVPMFSGDAEVIHEGFPTAKDNPAAIADAVKNAFAAIKTALDRQDIDVAQLSLGQADDTYNTIHVQHRQNHIFDRGHQPVRADVIIDMQSRENRGRQSRDSIENLVTGSRISRLGGFYDFVYAPAEGASSRGELYRSRDRRRDGEEYQLYALRFITTFIDTIDFGPTTQILALATARAAGDSQEIMRYFEPNLSLGENDMRNIGALAIEPNLQDLERGFGERWETKNSSFTSAKRSSLLRAVLNPGIIYSVDVPECGAATWQWIDFLAAAQGVGKSIRRLYDAACVLTDGHFEDLQRPDDPIIDSHVERIHGGYYTEGAGARLDIRDFDYLGLLNLLDPQKEDDLEVIQKWGMAAATNDDTVLSQSERFEILMNFVPTFVPTQFFQRYNYNSAFVKNLDEAISRCKVSLNPTSSGRDGSSRFRSTYGNIDQVLVGGGSGGLYRHQRGNRDRLDDRYGDRQDERYGGRW